MRSLLSTLVAVLTRLPRPLRVVLALLATATLLVQNRFQLMTARHIRLDNPVLETAEVMYVPDTRLMRLLFLGYDQAAADVMWLRTTEYFGRHFVTDRRYQWLEHFIDLILELDPRFRKVYHWAATNVLYGRTFVNEYVERSNHYFRRALEQFPDDWEAAYGLGMNYYVEMKSDDPEERRRFREQGVQYLEMAANMPGAPDFLRRLVASLYRKLGKGEVALQYYLELYLQADDPEKRKILRERMAEFRADVDVDALAAFAARMDERHRQSFPYLTRSLFLLLDRPDGDAVPDVDWRTLLPIVRAAGPNAVEMNP